MKNAAPQVTKLESGATGSPPPSNPIDESTALAAVLGGAVAGDEAVSFLREEYFYHGPNREIFARWKRLFEAGEDTSFPSIASVLSGTGLQDAIKFVAAILDFPEHRSLTSDSALACFARLKVLWQLRESLQVIHMAQSKIYLRETVNPTELMVSLNRELEAVCGSADTRGAISFKELAKAEAIRANSGLIAKRTKRTGFDCVDKEMGGISPGELVVVGGRPAMGKTSFAMNVARNIAESGERVLVLSLEMSPQSLMERAMASEMKMSLAQYKNLDFSKFGRSELLQAATTLVNLPIDVIDAKGFTILDVREAIISFRNRAQRDGVKVGCAVLDYLQLLTPHEKMERRDLEVAAQSRELKILAGEMEAPFIVLSQLNRGVESRPDKRPTMSDLRESGSIENDADSVLLLYRNCYYSKREDEKDQADLIVAKNRNGPSGSHKLKFIADQVRFENAPIEYQQVKDFSEIQTRHQRHQARYP